MKNDELLGLMSGIDFHMPGRRIERPLTLTVAKRLQEEALFLFYIIQHSAVSGYQPSSDALHKRNSYLFKFMHQENKKLCG